MNPAFTAESAIYGHVSPETARLVPDYPYGRRLRCEIRYWIETSARNGDRFVSQTRNPNTGRWNNPKKSTYSDVMVMFVDPENGHVKYASASAYSSDEWLEQFIAVVGDNLTVQQRRQLAHVIGVKKVFEHVTFTVVPDGTPVDEEAQAATNQAIGRAIAVETHRALGQLG